MTRSGWYLSIEKKKTTASSSQTISRLSSKITNPGNSREPKRKEKRARTLNFNVVCTIAGEKRRFIACDRERGFLITVKNATGVVRIIPFSYLTFSLSSRSRLLEKVNAFLSQNGRAYMYFV